VGALDDMLAAAEAATEPAPVPEPRGLLVEVEGGHLYHPLPLPGALAPEAWIAQAAAVLGPDWTATARWALVASGPHDSKPEHVKEWRSVADTAAAHAST
jgi:hypothetical protein